MAPPAPKAMTNDTPMMSPMGAVPDTCVGGPAATPRAASAADDGDDCTFARVGG
jgi:hypothetical protein